MYFHPAPHLTLTAATGEGQAGHWLSYSANGKPRPSELEVQVEPEHKASPRATSVQDA